MADGSEPLLAVKYAGHGGEPSDNLYIAGLPSPCVDQAALGAAIASLGLAVVRTKVIPDTRGQGSSAAMVQFSSQDDARTALEALNGLAPSQVGLEPGSADAAATASAAATSRSPSSNTIAVKFAGHDGAPSDNIYISGLPSPSVDMAGLQQLFSDSGFGIIRSKVIPDTRGSGSSAAMVQLSSVDEAQSAMAALNGYSPAECGLVASQGTISVAAPAKGVGKVGVRPSPVFPVAVAAKPLAPKPRQLAGPASLPVRAVASTLSSPASAGGEPAMMVKFKGTGGPSDTLYLNGLPAQGITEDDLYSVFTSLQCSVVWSKTVPDTKGIGSSAAMVQLGSQDEAAYCIETLNGQRWSAFSSTGRAPARGIARASSTPSPQNAAGDWLAGLQVKYAGGGAPCDNLYLSGLPSPSVEQSELEEMFKELGVTVVRSKVIPDTKGIGSSAAMVQLASTSEATYAMSQLVNGSAAAAPSPRSVAAAPVGSGGPMVVAPPAKKLRTGPASWAPGPAESAEVLMVKYKGEEGQPSDTVYIRGLPSPQVEATELANVFSGLGLQVGWNKVVPDSKGIGSSAALVQCGNVDEAAVAIENLNGRSWSEVSAALAGTSSPSKGSRGWPASPAAASPNGKGSRPVGAPLAGDHAQQGLAVKYAGQEGTPSDNLYISGLPSPSVEQAALDELITSLGLTVKRSKIIPDTRGTGSSAALVQVGSMEEAATAIDLLRGQVLDVVGLGAGSASDGGDAHAAGAWEVGAVPTGDSGSSILRVKYAGQSGEPSDNLYISGLPSPQVDAEQLHQLFAEMEVQVLRSKIIPDTKGTGSSAAMVQVSSVDEATAIIGALSGQPCPLTAGSQSNGGGTPAAASRASWASAQATPNVLSLKFAGQGNVPSDNLYISGLPSPQVEQHTLTNLFNGLNMTVIRSKVIPDTKGLGSSAAMVQLGSVEEAQQAIDVLQGQQLGDE